MEPSVASVFSIKLSLGEALRVYSGSTPVEFILHEGAVDAVGIGLLAGGKYVLANDSVTELVCMSSNAIVFVYGALNRIESAPDVTAASLISIVHRYELFQLAARANGTSGPVIAFSGPGSRFVAQTFYNLSRRLGTAPIFISLANANSVVHISDLGKSPSMLTARFPQYISQHITSVVEGIHQIDPKERLPQVCALRYSSPRGPTPSVSADMREHMILSQTCDPWEEICTQLGPNCLLAYCRCSDGCVCGSAQVLCEAVKSLVEAEPKRCLMQEGLVIDLGESGKVPQGQHVDLIIQCVPVAVPASPPQVASSATRKRVPRSRSGSYSIAVPEFASRTEGIPSVELELPKPAHIEGIPCIAVPVNLFQYSSHDARIRTVEILADSVMRDVEVDALSLPGICELFSSRALGFKLPRMISNKIAPGTIIFRSALSGLVISYDTFITSLNGVHHAFSLCKNRLIRILGLLIATKDGIWWSTDLLGTLDSQLLVEV